MDAGIFALDKQTMITVGIQLLNACVLAAVLTYLLYKPVRKFMQKRADGIGAQLNRAEEDRAAADQLKARYEQQLADIDLERIKILEEAQRFAAEKKSQLLDETEKEIAAMKERAAADLRAERGRANEELKLHMIETAAAMAEKFVAFAMDENTRDRLFDETLAELEGAVL